MDILEIRDYEIDVDELVRKIQKNINERKNEGAYEEGVISELYNKDNSHFSEENGLDSQLNLEYMLNNWDIKNETYSITSHRPIVGKILVPGRKTVHGEVKRYVDPVIFLQSEFNERVANFNNILYQKYMGIKEENKTLKSELTLLKAKFDRLSNQLTELNSYKCGSKLFGSNLKGNKVKTSANADGNSARDTSSMNYFLFSEEMSKAWEKEGGACASVPNVFEDSKEFFKNCNNVLDIGCGPGTFLRFMKEAQIGSYGIDINEDYISLCERVGCNVVENDAISHLKSLEPKSIDGVFMNQLAEHLSSDELLEILKLCYEKMQYGTYIVITTPNIKSVIVSSNLFYLDPTHLSHVHPEVLKFMLHSCGFRDIENRYYQPVAEDLRLRNVASVEQVSEEDPNSLSEGTMKVLNENIDKLNSLLFGSRDVCVIAKK